MVADIADEEAACRINRDAVRLAKLRAGRGTAVAAEARSSGSSERGNDAGRAVHPAYDVIVTLGNVQIALRVELNFVRHVQRCRSRGPAVATVALLPVAGHGRRSMAFQIEPPNPLVIEIAEVQRAIGPDQEAIRIVDLAIGV